MKRFNITFSLVLFLSVFLPRAIYLVALSTIWHFRAKEFLAALLRQDWSGTLLAPHPGVTTMWLLGIARWMGAFFVADMDKVSLFQQLVVESLPQMFVIACTIVLAYFILVQIFGRQVAVVATLLLAFDPFHIAISKTLHPEALLSVFMMVSALWLILYTKRQRRRYILFSGIFMALALLSKITALFIVPFFFLGLLTWKIDDTLVSRRPLSMLKLRTWYEWAKEIAPIFLLFLLAVAITYTLLWPSMWTQPGKTLEATIGSALFYSETAHENPILFMGQVTTKDPGPLFYPVIMLLKSTEIVLLFFVLGIATLFNKKLEHQHRLAIFLTFAFIIFYTIQMTLGDKKIPRYILPPLQFMIIIAGFSAVHFSRWLTNSRRSLYLPYLLLSLIVVGQFAIAFSRHPYYDTHFNRLFGSPRRILESGILPGQENGEGLDLAADYLNSLPMSPLLVVGSTLQESLDRHFRGVTVPLTNDDSNVDYLVFHRNWIVRGMKKETWVHVWQKYQQIQPKFVAKFDDVPYVWVYKTRPQIDETTISNSIDAELGQDIHLSGYNVAPTQVHPGGVFTLTLFWEAVHKPSGDYTVFIHVLDPMGNIRAQKDNQPQEGFYPTTLWDKGERIEDRYNLTISPDVPSGAYDIAIGMYTLSTLERLPVRIMPDNVVLANQQLLIRGPEVILSPE